MKQSRIWRARVLMLMLLLVLCSSGGIAGGAEEVGVVGDCFPDEPVLTPDMPEYHNRQGGSYYSQGQYDLAIASYHKALELDPSNDNGYYGLAFTYRAQGRLDLAIENYSEVIRLVPDYAQPYASRAAIYQFIGRYDDAEKDLDSYVKHYGQYPNPYLARGDFFMERRDYSSAAEDYAIAIEKNPNLQEAYIKYAGALLLSGRPEEASTAFEQAIMFNSTK
jgi:tetratricopeptide (TPR) repeat protein